MNRWQRALYTPVKPLGEGGRIVTGSSEHIELSRRAAGEGMVLVKNEGGVLPLDAKKLKKKSVTVKRAKVLTVKKAKGDLIYTKKKGNKKITINYKTGKVKLKKGLKKGKYKVTATVFAAGNSKYGQATKKRTFKIVVK